MERRERSAQSAENGRGVALTRPNRFRARRLGAYANTAHEARRNGRNVQLTED